MQQATENGKHLKRWQGRRLCYALNRLPEPDGIIEILMIQHY